MPIAAIQNATHGHHGAGLRCPVQIRTYSGRIREETHQITKKLLPMTKRYSNGAMTGAFGTAENVNQIHSESE